MRRNSQGVGGVRASALWGTGGRGPRKIGSIGAVVALVLCLPLAAGARSSSVHTHSTTVPPSLVSAALAHPQQMFDVIIQSAGGADSADVARTVRGTVRSRVVKRQYRALRSVSASVTGAGLLRLTKQHGIYAITPNSRVTSTVKQPAEVAGRDRESIGTGARRSPKAGAATIAIVDSGIDNSNRQFGDRLLTQVDFTPSGSSTRADGRGHGTFVAGVAASAGRFGGAAPNAKLVSLKVFDDQGRGMTSDVFARPTGSCRTRTSTASASQTSRFRPGSRRPSGSIRSTARSSSSGRAASSSSPQRVTTRSTARRAAFCSRPRTIRS